MPDGKTQATGGDGRPALVEIRDALICWYDIRNDPCDKHLGEDGFQRCKACRMRDRIDALIRRNTR